jgi:hypothetical protein
MQRPGAQEIFLCFFLGGGGEAFGLLLSSLVSFQATRVGYLVGRRVKMYVKKQVKNKFWSITYDTFHLLLLEQMQNGVPIAMFFFFNFFFRTKKLGNFWTYKF